MGCLAVLLLGLAAVARAGDEVADSLAEVRAKGVIEIAVYAQFPPYSYGASAADAEGIDVELARAIAHSLGLQLKLRMISAGESVDDDLRNHIWKGHYLGGGVADLMLHVGYDPRFADGQKNAVLFAPYFHEMVVVAYRPGRIPHLESPIALAEHKIAVAGDTISDHIMSGGYGGALRTTAIREPSLEEAVKALGTGEADGVMGPQGELQGLLAKQRLTGLKFYPQPPVGQMRTAWDVAMAVRAGRGTGFSDAISAALSGLKADGSLAGIFAAHGVNYVDPETAAPPNIPARRHGEISKTRGD
jgi:ABC-type amino acid transport substrate-binding protein